MTKSKTKIVIGILLTVAILFVIGVSYAIWSMTLQQSSSNVVTTGCFNVEYTDNNPINIQSAYPITDEEGKKLTPYTFTITNTCDMRVLYQVNLELLDTSTLLNHSYLKVQLAESEPDLLSNYEVVTKTILNATTSYKLETGVLSKKGSKTFTLRLWLNENTPATEDAMNKSLESKIVIQTVSGLDTYTEEALNGADPVLKEGLIPVTIENDGTVKKADMKEKWYSYEEKIWANAVILKNESVAYSDGSVIPEDNIESYFVWIPRYKYKIFNDNLYDGLTEIDNSKVQRIEVEFESNDVTPSVGNKTNQWLTHPAFTSFDSNGFWVGKFETSKSNGSSENAVNPMGVQIKPNIASWRNIQIGNAFYTSYYYERNLDSHMMKNTEWGAIAYLQYSKYGSETKIRINNNSNFLTGYAAVKEPTCGYTADNRDCNKYGTTPDLTQSYNTEIGYLASTTGNISGIYDMSGGSHEYVMAVMVDQNGNPLSGASASLNSGFNGQYGSGGSLANGYDWPLDKYYDKYVYGTSDTNHTRRILGDATGELGPFSKLLDFSINSWGGASLFVNLQFPWFFRGLAIHYGKDAGIFSFQIFNGSPHSHISFRLVLSPI